MVSSGGGGGAVTGAAAGSGSGSGGGASKAKKRVRERGEDGGNDADQGRARCASTAKATRKRQQQQREDDGDGEEEDEQQQQDEEEDDEVEENNEDGQPAKQQQQQRGRGGGGSRRTSKRGRGSAPAGGGSEEPEAGSDDGIEPMDEDDDEEQQEEEQQHEEEEEDENVRIENALRHAQSARGAAAGVLREKGLAGHVKAVKLINFMCHEHFEMEFSSHVNFISGQNGSGKSAVLQALQICLGATARETGRGRSLRELIRTGADDATLRVTLWNTGADAFRPRELGEHVTIERRIVKSRADAAGVSSTWKVYGANGRPVERATRRNLIEPLLDHLNIAADNPLCVMTQDKAREFLCAAGHSRRLLYSLFMETTLMADFKAKLERTAGMVAQMQAKVAEVESAHAAKEAALKALRARLEKLRRVAGLEERREALERAVVWAAVREREDELARVERSLGRLAADRRAALEARVAQADAKLGALRERQQGLRARLAELNEFADGVNDAMARLGGECKAAKAAVKSLAAARETSYENYQSTQANMTQMSEALAAAGADRSKELLRDLEAQAARLEGLRRDKAAAEAEAAAVVREVDDGRRRQAEIEQELELTRSQMFGLKKTIEHMERDRRDLAASLGNRAVRFGGPKAAALAQLVESNAARFTQPPIGPMGAHLSLTDARWSTAAEAVLGPHLDKWVVACRRDEQLLRDLARRAGLPGVVVITKRFDAPAYAVPPAIAEAVKPPYRLLRSLVAIDHPRADVLDKLLMDLAHYERVAVAETAALARDVAYNGVLGAHVTTCVAIDGLRCGRGGPGRTCSTQRYHARRGARLGHDAATGLRELEAALASERRKLQQLRERDAALGRELKDIQLRGQAAYDRARGLQHRRNRLETEIHNSLLQAAEAEAGGGDIEDPEMQARVEALRLGMAGAQADLEVREAELAAAKEREERATKQYEDLKERTQTARDELAAATEELQRAMDEIGQEAAARDEAQQEIDSLSERHKSGEAARAALAEDTACSRALALEVCGEDAGDAALAEAKARIEDHFRSVLRNKVVKDKSVPLDERAARVEQQLAELDCRPTAVAVKKLHEAIERAIADARSEAGGSAAELEAEEARLAASVAADAALVGGMRDVYRRTSRALRRRQEGYASLFDSVQKTVSQRFMGYMMRRKYQGKLRISDDTGELRLLVKITGDGKGGGAAGGAGGGARGKGAAAADRAVTDLKTLSGGERSYTNVAFALALGEYVEAPFRCMDEYDVFMDAVNRRVATETLLQFALEKGHVQHIFLTPQDVSAIGDARRHLEERTGAKLGDGFVRTMRMAPARG